MFTYNPGRSSWLSTLKAREPCQLGWLQKGEEFQSFQSNFKQSHEWMFTSWFTCGLHHQPWSTLSKGLYTVIAAFSSPASLSFNFPLLISPLEAVCCTLIHATHEVPNMEQQKKAQDINHIKVIPNEKFQSIQYHWLLLASVRSCHLSPEDGSRVQAAAQRVVDRDYMNMK